MAIQTRRELLERLEERETENEEVQGRLDEIADLVALDEEEGSGEEGEE